MTISRDLFLAILSMDSYNRGYGVGLTFRNQSNQIGNATIGEDALTLLSQGTAEAAGFYALAYDVSNAGISGLTGTVVSYRGTNFDTGDTVAEFFASPLVQDALSGWTVGAGLLTRAVSS
jgi:hypothetical protein